MDIEQLLQQMGMSGGYQQSNPQGPTIGPQGPAPDPFGGMGKVDTPTIQPGNSDILGNLIVGQKLRSLDELRAQRLKQEQPATKMGKANEYLKAILSGFTHTAYKDPAKRAEELSQKDFALETQRATSEAKDIKNLIDQQRYQAALAQKIAEAKQREDKDKRDLDIKEARMKTGQAWLDLARAKTPAQIQEILSRTDLNAAKSFDLLNPKNAHAAVYVQAQDQLNKEFAGQDLSDPKTREKYNNRRTELESDMHKGITMMQMMPKESSSQSMGVTWIDTPAGAKQFPNPRSSSRNAGAGAALQDVARRSGMMPGGGLPNIMGQPSQPGQPSPFTPQAQPQATPTQQIVAPIVNKGKPQPPPLSPGNISDLPLIEADIPGVMRNGANQKIYDTNTEVATSINNAAGTLIKDFEHLKDYSGAIRGSDLVQKVARATGNSNINEQTVLQNLENARGVLLLQRSGTAVSDQENQRMKRYTASLQATPERVLADTLLFKFSRDLLSTQKQIDWKKAGIRNPENAIQQTNMADFLINKVEEVIKLTKAGKKQEATDVLKTFQTSVRKELAKQIAAANRTGSSTKPKTIDDVSLSEIDAEIARQKKKK